MSEDREVRDIEEVDVEQEDVEGHVKKHKHEADPTASDDSDDVEAHVKKHKVD